MSNVKVTATGETGLEVDVVLGANVRKTHAVPGGESVDLAIGGGQVLSVRAASNVAPAAELPVGVDVSEGLTELEKAADEEAAAAREVTGLEKGDFGDDDDLAAAGASLFDDQP